jgi:hypothetical protein
MVPASGNNLPLQAITHEPAFFLTLLGGQNAGVGDNLRIRLRPVGLTRGGTALLQSVHHHWVDFRDAT